HVHGIDIEPACKVYEGDAITVHIGDQADRNFWARFKAEVPRVDILIDDGGHTPEQQRITLEEMLPHLSPGGVFICEDIHGAGNPFGAYVRSLSVGLDAFAREAGDELASAATPLQGAIESISFAPYIVAIERRRAPIQRLSAPRHGTQWQPF